MGRHRAEHSNSGIAKELIFGVLAVLVVIALLVGWFVLRDSNSRSHNSAGKCPAGDISIPTALVSGASELKALQDEFLATKPVIQDYCINDFKSAEVDKAALVYTEGGNQDTTQILEQAKKTPTSSQWPIVGLSEIGVAVPNNRSAGEFANWTNVTDVVSVTEDALAGAIASEAMKEKLAAPIPREQAVSKKQAFITSQNSVPTGYTFVLPDQPSALQLPTRAIAITTSAGVSEEQSRAAAAFVDYAAKKTTTLDGPAANAIQKALSVPPTTSTAPEQPKQPTIAKSDTLVVLDTSDMMAPQYPGVAAGLAERITRLGADGHHIGLWNYSSPLSAGVVKGWRPNVNLSDNSKGANAAAAVTRFGTGGRPYTHEAAVAALLHAMEVSAETKQPVKVVLINAGTADAGSQGNLAAALQGVDSSKVTLHLINVGKADPELSQWATSHGGTSADVTTAEQRNEAIDRALGL